MTTMAERIAAHQGERETFSFDVEEWGETIYHTPMLAGELSKLQRKHPNILTPEGMTNFEALVDLIVDKALDENGERAFTIKEKPFLRRQDYSVIARVGGELMLGGRDIGDIEKN